MGESLWVISIRAIRPNPNKSMNGRDPKIVFVELQVLGQGPGVDFTFAWDNNNNNKNDKNPHLNFLKGTVLGDKEQGIRDQG